MKERDAPGKNLKGSVSELVNHLFQAVRTVAVHLIQMKRVNKRMILHLTS